MDDPKSSLRRTIPQTDERMTFNRDGSLGFVKLGDVLQADVFDHLFGQANPEPQKNMSFEELKEKEKAAK